MKFFHLSDLHLGKIVHEFSMTQEQEHILGEILAAARVERPDAVLVAGDVFDRSVAPAEALRLLDGFLVSLSQMGIQVFLIAGNHDSADRLAFAAQLISTSGVHIAPAYDGSVMKHTLTDEYGEVDIFLLPFLRPVMVRKAFEEEKVETWTDAVRVALSKAERVPGRRSVLLSHQFVTGGQTCESEELSVGGADNVDASAYLGFDYVALGHLHGPQTMGQAHLRYCGSPIKYSFSEVSHKKSLTVVTMKEPGNIEITPVPLTPLRDFAEVKGSYEQVTSKAFYDTQNRDNYYRITLTDEEDQPGAMQKLRVIYPHLMRLMYDNKRTQKEGEWGWRESGEALTPLMLFEKLFETQNGQQLSQEQRDYISGLIDDIREDAR
ncbi:MAG: exonuclease SbcCD subunit D [Clostridiales bacterium]|nr:exonuclease SbcCD subunit D [Clostridiales bacterium]